MADIKLEANIVFDSYLPDALRHALEYAGNDGFVASMPQLLHARVNAAYSNIIWNTWFSSNSEESVVTTPQGNHVMVAVHGGGILASPERFERTYRASVNRFNQEGYTGQYAARISPREVCGLLDGRLQDGTEFPIYPFEEFNQGIAALPRRYGVILDFELARKSTNGIVPFDTLKQNPLMIIRAGGVEAAEAYLDRARDRHNTTMMGNWHPFHAINPDQPQTRISFLSGNNGGVGSEDKDTHLYGFDAESGIRGDLSVIKMARYVALAHRDEASLRHVDFGT